MALRILLRSRLGLRPAVRLCFFRSLQARMYSLDHDRTSQPTATGSARIWVRGTPQRFKLRGLVISSLIASLLSGLIYIWSTESDTLHRRGLKLDAVSALVRVQFVDSEKYATVDFSSYQASLDYFAHLLGFTPYLTTLKPGRDLFEVFSFEFEDTKRRDQVHTILRETAEKAWM
ncbi:hypothetical protein K438DRAFT_932647 [Mycena galopus ATCC 62051]|nr:hypothetical protein K438DRAFT_932647 [Mycena galopus ATCC 62051]